MSIKKRQVRDRFRTVTFGRDNFTCVTCRVYYRKTTVAVDAHHITDREKMPNGGYVVSNGISLCADCHLQAERWEIAATRLFWPESLYELIGSSYEQAVADSLRLR